MAFGATTRVPLSFDHLMSDQAAGILSRWPREHFSSLLAYMFHEHPV